ncbi:MAG: hypothetical protein IJ086_00710 [Clostridium sp.]|nr:hypothetical protein [Clostridium sp.]
MINQEAIKKNLFTIKKINVVKNDTWGSPVREIHLGKTLNIKEMVGILTPYFNDYNKTFNNEFLKVITLDGQILNVKADCIEIKKTRVTDNSVKEELNKLIASLKEEYKFQKEQIKFYEDLKNKENIFSDKSSNHEKTINTLIGQVKKSQGILSCSDVFNSFNNILKQNNILKYNTSWSSNRHTPNRYYIEATDGNETDTISIEFLGFNIVSITISKEVLIDVYRDFDLNKEISFLRKNYFKTINSSKLKDIGATESFSEDFVEEDFITIEHTIKLDLNIKTTTQNMKDIERRFDTLLKLIHRCG